MRPLTGRETALTGLFAALTAVGALVSIPLGPVPFTLQVMFTLMAGAFLGSRLGAYSQVVYILMGVVGLPVFSQRGAGPGHLLEPTGGFIFGFILGAWLTGRVTERWRPRGRVAKAGVTVAAMLLGGVGIYALGVPWLAFTLKLTLGEALALMSPYMIGDLVKIGLGAAFIEALAARGFAFPGFAGGDPAEG